MWTAGRGVAPATEALTTDGLTTDGLTTELDLLIVDINMPQMDGLTFLAKLRGQDGPQAAIPALVTSTEAQAQDVEAARKAGADSRVLAVCEPVLPKEWSIPLGTSTNEPAGARMVW